MVEMLAVMERQNVDWGNDDVTVREEVGFVQAYLELQKYRFEIGCPSGLKSRTPAACI